MSVRASIPVDLGERGYSITIGDGLIDQAGQQIAPLLRNDDVILVTDENVNQTAHPARLIQALHSKGVTCRPFVVPAGEASKDFATWQKLTSDILNARIDRKTSVIALGGGVVGDLAGFAAAALLRGLDFFQVPTSLLAMVDSSVGGKTGINAPAGKNLVGAFHQPRHVLIDTSVLADLPARELRCGYAELVKHALIRDLELFAWLDGRVEQLMRNDNPALIAEAIDRSVRIKAAIVGEDERETSGTRALLNFGHTFGHAYEAIAGYDGRLLHGEAVALGMVRAMTLSMQMDQTNEIGRASCRERVLLIV